MRLLVLSFLLLSVAFTFTSIAPAHGAPLSVRDSSSNTQFFKNRVFACKGFNCNILFRKEEVTPELVEELRNNPEAVKDRNQTQTTTSPVES